MQPSQVKLEIYVPAEFVPALRDALTEAGACHVGKYDHVVTFYPVEGCWRPLPGSNPYDGEVGKIQNGRECKMELRCPTNKVKEAVQVINKLHPYEQPVINIVPLLNDQFGVE